jgi:hypothetical protein
VTGVAVPTVGTGGRFGTGVGPVPVVDRGPLLGGAATVATPVAHPPGPGVVPGRGKDVVAVPIWVRRGAFGAAVAGVPMGVGPGPGARDGAALEAPSVSGGGTRSPSAPSDSDAGAACVAGWASGKATSSSSGIISEKASAHLRSCSCRGLVAGAGASGGFLLGVQVIHGLHETHPSGSTHGYELLFLVLHLLRGRRDLFHETTVYFSLRLPFALIGEGTFDGVIYSALGIRQGCI